MNTTNPQLSIPAIRDASRRLVRELGFMKPTLAGTHLPASAVHALIEIGENGISSAAELCDVLCLEKSSVSRMLRKLIDNGELIETCAERDGREKQLTLSAKGHQTLAAINQFAYAQVSNALINMPASAQSKVQHGLSIYGEALAASRKKVHPTVFPVEHGVNIVRGYRPGVLGRAVEMHARYYAGFAGFGHFFEAKVASGMAEFAGRMDKSCNQLWFAMREAQVVAVIAIDGEDLGSNIAHLRWFIVDDEVRGSGIGRRLLSEAISFCEQQQFSKIQLWTFRGLDTARRLYEAAGFVLREERPGRQWGEEVMEQRFSRPVLGGQL
ncbi:bifunctional helix-turn-helix transcriptional regulator/GNAT family N-acetyltransferase [Undibacterium sp. Di27W]|uniref:bifunctional helix-turn-helix transcriptional regulator/GNAT family N-acetyltransferase n=1 Tax=Undibacterium sp. Di27W TaxID=3413036 RepID=UPI003BF34A8A